MIISVWKLLLIWIIIGTVIYLYSRYKGKKEGHDYAAALREWEQ